MPWLRQVGVRGEHADDVASSHVGVEAEQQVRRRQVEEVQRVRLQDLAVVHQPADLLGGRRQRGRADHRVHRLGGGEVVETGQMPHSRCTITGTSQYGRPWMKRSKPRNSTMCRRT
jgi:hypothetical protein